MAGPEGEERLQGSRGERRFSALNPHGNVDFELPSGGVSEYLGKSDVSMPFLALRRTAHLILKTTIDALTSHASYWADPNFGAFLLAGKQLSQLSLSLGIHLDASFIILPR
jgi:hypothetical protein